MRLTRWMVLCPIFMVVGCTISTTTTDNQPDTTPDTQPDTTPDDSPLAMTGTITIALPSDSAGGAPLTLEVHMYAPDAENARYVEGAPIVVMVPGGHKPDTASSEDAADVVSALEQGFIHLSFSMPGTLNPVSGRGTAGDYDYRGPNCKRALADTILFALGKLADVDGKVVTDHVSFALPDNVGVAAWSNGGNLALTTLAEHGDELGSLAWLVTWESPIGDQYVTAELGGGHGAERTLNSYYTPGTSTVNTAPWPGMGEVLAFDSLQSMDLEDPATGQTTSVAGTLFLDEDSNGLLDEGEFFFTPAGGPGVTVADLHLPKAYTSVELATLVDENAARLFPAGMPTWLATLEEVEAYWADRDGSLGIDAVITALPDLTLLAVASEEDHVQAQPDHPHIRSLVNGWLDAGGAFARLNPDADYLAELTGEQSSEFPDNEPNETISYPGIEDMLMPESVNGTIVDSTTMMTAASMEMADRTQGTFGSTAASTEVTAFVDSPENGRIAVRLRQPSAPRYDSGAPIIVNVPVFFIPTTSFSTGVSVSDIGLIDVGFVWPGKEDRASGAASDGTFDYGGPNCMAGLRDVIRFATGLVPDVDGAYIQDLLTITPLTDNVGLYAFSHPGIAATNVMAYHGDDLPKVAYIVGGENPTQDALSCVEIGHWSETSEAIFNPFYTYPDDYSAMALNIDYSTVGWLQNDDYPDGRAFFEVAGGDDYVLGDRIPTMWDKRYYSIAMTQALLDNGALTAETWPDDLATVEETQATWPYRTTADNYATLSDAASQLKVMLFFARDDHVHPALDKPHIHQAYDGFVDGAGLWTRLNPDLVYVQHLVPDKNTAGFPDNDANTQPTDWLESGAWAYPNRNWSKATVGQAAIAEMADRVHADVWDDNLEAVLID